ncbi:TRAP transporter small permease [Pelagibius marinus]|uniref:TRAP transporter small permease n=1 Tax=Pelagibius marinus TaxID=2762760 RepID=UPI001D050F12|nr:TRAP transporter small permease [Pelagibius marinus]
MMSKGVMTKGLLSQIELVVGVVLLAAIVGLVFLAAVMRFFGTPLIWSVDLAQLLFIWLCFLGANRALRRRVHLGIDLLIQACDHRRRLVLDLVLGVLVVVFLGVLAVEGVKLTLLNTERLFGDSGIPYAFVTIAVPVGCVFLAFTVIANALEAIRRRGEGRLLVFGRRPGDAPGDLENELRDGL